MEHLRTPGFEGPGDRLRFSSAVAARGLLVLAGVTGTRADGGVASDPEEQFEQTFAHLRANLALADATLADVIEITI